MTSSHQMITFTRNSNKIIPASNYYAKPISLIPPVIPELHEDTINYDISDKLLVPTHNNDNSPALSKRHRIFKSSSSFSSFIRSFINTITFNPNILIPTCNKFLIPFSSPHVFITPSLPRKLTGTLFGYRRGHVSFAVQDDPRSEPVLLIELAISTSMLVKEMSSGLVRIALECEKIKSRSGGLNVVKLFNEPRWSMYCNGRKCGYAVSRKCMESDWHVLRTVQSVSVGAGVIPVVEDARKRSEREGELLFMRAKFERVAGSRDSEAFYMLNPDGNGGPELSIFLLRI